MGMGQEAADREIEETFDDADEVKKNNDMYFNQLQDFYEEVVSNMIMYDPLDRPIPDEEDD